VRTSAELQIGGTLTAPKIEGRIDARGCILNLESIEVEGSQNASDVVLTPADVRMMEETFGYQAAPAPSPLEPIFDASDIDLMVSLGRGNWVRKRGGPRLAMEVTGEVHARKPPFEEFDLRGNLAPVAGTSSTLAARSISPVARFS
jgi:hypothetical protein